MEWCKEVEDAIQIVVRCSMDPATLDKQVDHIHGLQGAAAGHVEVGKDYQLEGVGMDYQFEEAAHGKEAASAASRYRGEAENNQPVASEASVAAQEVGSMVFEDEDLFAVVNQVVDFDLPQRHSCCYKHLSF